MKNRDFDKFVLIFLIQFFEYALLTFELAIFIFVCLLMVLVLVHMKWSVYQNKHKMCALLRRLTKVKQILAK